jgi:LysR family transcriptional regulator of gallate degradation
VIPDLYDLNLRHLRALIAVQTGGSISAGSRLACLSQSALTQGIAKIERQLGCVLFERQTDGVAVTPEGESALQRIRAALGHIDEATRALGRSREQSVRSITMTHVRALISLADARSFATAAVAAALSQTSVHRAVGDLERLINKRLVDRRGQGTLLSFTGRRLVRGFRLAGSELRAMVSELSDDERVAPILIGALPIARPFIVPTAIAQMVRENPRARFIVAEGDWQDLVEQLQDGVIDLIIGAIRDNKIGDLMQEPLSDDQVVVLCGRHHPLAADPAPSLDELARYPWIVAPPLSPLRRQWESLFADMERPECPVECESIMVVINLLAQSEFLTLASPRQVELPIQTKRLTQLGGVIEGSTRSVGIITRKSWRPTLTERRFMRLLAEAARSSGAAPITMQQAARTASVID